MAEPIERPGFRSKLKAVIAHLGAHGWMPPAFAVWLIQAGGLRHE